MSLKFIVMATLVTALVVLTSCKREERTFSVPIADAKTTQSSPNTPVKVGGPTALVLTYERPSPRPEGLESNAYALAQGKLLYEAMNCAGCHATHGGGSIGPALSDATLVSLSDPIGHDARGSAGIADPAGNALARCQADHAARDAPYL